MAVYDGLPWQYRYRVTFEGKHITEIANRLGIGSHSRWVPLYSSGKVGRLTRQQAEHLGRCYGLRHDLSRRRVLANSMSLRAPIIEFDQDAQQWHIVYQWGRPEIAGGVWTIVLDKQGRLVRMSETIVSR